MYGAILGDIIGSPYEFDWQNIKTKEFPLFRFDSEFTDDSVMTIAVAEALMAIKRAKSDTDNWKNCASTPEEEEQLMKFTVARSLKKWGNE